MIYIGCHLSVADGYEAMGKRIKDFGGNTFAWFTRNPRGGKSKPIIREDVNALIEYSSENGFGPLVAHGSYTMNLCSANEETRSNGIDMLKKDLEIMEMLPSNYYNFHPGSHTGQGTETGIEQISSALNEAMKSDMKTTVLLESMAGKGSEVGGTFMDQCDTCAYMSYDEEQEEYYCSVDMDDCVIIVLTSEKPINTGLANVSPIFFDQKRWEQMPCRGIG